MRLTFAYSFLGADLCAVLHRMQSEIDFGDLFLVLHCADCIVDVGALVARLAVHFGGLRLFCFCDLKLAMYTSIESE